MPPTDPPPPPKSNWWDAFPEPRSTAPLLTRDKALVHLVLADATPAPPTTALLLVDVRRTDYEGGTIQGSLNIPAHSFYWNRAVLYQLCKRAGIEHVAFYCGR